MGVTAQRTRQTEHPLPEYRSHRYSVYRYIARVPPRWRILTNGPLDGHNNGADLRCNSWFGKEITQKCDQSGQRDSSEQRQPATSILRHHSMAEVDLELTTPKTTKIVRSTPFYDVSDRGINVLQRTTLECPSGHPAKLGHTLEASLFIHSRRFGSHSSPPRSAESPD